MVTIAKVKATVAQHYGITVADIDSHKRARRFSRPRQVAMYLARRLAQRSLPDIGYYVGNRDHSTVQYAVDVIERRRRRDDAFDAELWKLIEELTPAALGGIQP